MPPLSMYEQQQRNCVLRRANSAATTSSSDLSSNDSSMVRVSTTTMNKPLVPTEPLSNNNHNHRRSSSAIPATAIRSTKAKKSVTFAPHVRAKRHLHVNDFTPEELEACWFDGEDFECIKDECQAIALVCSSSKFLVEDNDKLGFCKRGIEHLTQKGMKRRLQNKVTGWDAVLDAQQDVVASSDPTVYIAKAYHKISYECLIAAHARGLQDEKDSPLACLL